MRYVNWAPNTPIESPVYLDANILVGTIVNSHPLYASCAQLTAGMLISNTRILISIMSLDESMWALAKLAYCDLFRKPSNAHWNKSVYDRWCERIFQSYGSWIEAPGKMLTDWRKAGAIIDFVPSTDIEFESVIDSAPKYMRGFKLTPADAFHLSVAEKLAKTFVTADSDFGKIETNPPSGDLTIVHLPKP